MMQLQRLTEAKTGATVWINLERVQSFYVSQQADCSDTVICFSSTDFLLVKETPEFIANSVLVDGSAVARGFGTLTSEPT